MQRSFPFIYILLVSMFPGQVLAADSYRWLHVTIETPWAIFIFLLPMVLIPIVLLAILQWRFASKKKAERTENIMQEKDKEAIN